MEYYPAIKMDQALFMLRSNWTSKTLHWAKEVKYTRSYDIWFHWYKTARTGKSIHRHRKQISGCQGLGKEGWRTAHEDVVVFFFFEVMKAVLEPDRGGACTTPEYTKKFTELYTINRWTVWYANYISLKKFFLNTGSLFLSEHSGNVFQSPGLLDHAHIFLLQEDKS